MAQQGSLSNLNKVTTVSGSVNPKIIGCITYQMENDIVYFIPESIFKSSLNNILEDVNTIKTLTKMKAIEADYVKFLVSQEITVEPYEVVDSFKPYDIVPMIF